ncbi:MAG: Bax inhibitor-1/YccA family protein [Metallibacterium sp.]
MASGNPLLRSSNFEGLAIGGERMTVNGTIGKTAIMLILVCVSAGRTWLRFDAALAVGGKDAAAAAMAAVAPFLMGGLIAGLVLALVSVFAKRFIAITAPLYAIAEGFVVGGISAIFDLSYPGVVVTAVALTFGVMAVMLFLYSSRIIKVTDKLRMGIVAATGGIMVVYLINMVMGFYASQIGLINSASPLGIGFSLLVVGIAAFNLLIDFDMIERGAAAGAPRNMEWYGAFGLTVTLVWLYIEILSLLGKLQRR